MKKKISLIVALILLISLGYFMYKGVIVNSFRYSTPEEAFQKSSPQGSELVDILEDKDIALLIYKKSNGVFSDTIIRKDQRGWPPISVVYHPQSDILSSCGFVYSWNIKNKYVVEVVSSIKKNSQPPIITDSLKSEFLLGVYESSNDEKLVYGFLVSEEKFPDDYKVIIGEEEIGLN